MPLRASCSFQHGYARVDSSWLSLNAPQGFMLIPTKGTTAAYLPNGLSGLNAPQGFMLIPTYAIAICAVVFMLS